MGKIVKFCTSCDEGFAEKFGFCPNCGKTLDAFEMNPVEAATAPAEQPAPVVNAVVPVDPVESYHEPVEPTAPAFLQTEPVAPSYQAADETEPEEIEEPGAKDVISVAPAVIPAPPVYTQSVPVDIDRRPISLEAEHEAYASDGGFYVTVIEEKNVGKRNKLMLGTLGIMVFSLMSGVVYSLFSKSLDVGSINDDIFNAVLVEDVPMNVEEEKQLKAKKDGGGGGGGGRDEKEETTQGDLANQTKNPVRPPDAKVFRSDNFQLKTPPPQTEGNRTFEKKFDRWGDPNGRFTNFSNGTGTGGGQGSGAGTGQGSGRGTGTGSGDGSGSGSGIGNANGGGTGVGDDGPPPPPKKAGVTQGLRIISKPRPGYTDAARQNNIQGTVILKVTFLASGQVGSISAVKGLPNGLTEKAIAAARQISFEPKKIDGIGQASSRLIEYTFSIY